jgi:carbonic anhydrase/acetyltransferase-like protein (isoleucine patch superfamily)
MVIKLAPVCLGDGCSVLEEGIVMPGARMEPGGVLLEKSQVLKGETLPSGEVWEGLPAERRDGVSSLVQAA